MPEENKSNKIKCAMCHTYKEPFEFGTRMVGGVEIRNKVCKLDLLKKKAKGSKAAVAPIPRAVVETLDEVDNVKVDPIIQEHPDDEKLVEEKGFLGAAFDKAKSAWCKMFPDKADQADAMLEKAKASKPVSAIINNEQVLIELANDTSAAVNSRLAELDNSSVPATSFSIQQPAATVTPGSTSTIAAALPPTSMDISNIGYKTIASTATLAEKITERHPRKPLYGLSDAIKINESNIKANLQEFPEIEPLLKYNRLLLTAINMGVIGYDMMDLRLKKFDQNPAYFGVDRDGNPTGTTMAVNHSGQPIPASAPKTELPRPSDTVAVQQLNGNIRPSGGDQPVQTTLPKWGFDSFGKS